jgi:sugar lactone lactonase YvrE
LYAINHDESWGESIEIFRFNEVRISLAHIGSIRSPLFFNFGLNDVVEGVDGEVFVTEWKPYGLPAGGKFNPQASKLIKARDFLVVDVMKWRLAHVFRCTIEDGACAVASQPRFVAANGIAISHDRRTVYVNDPPMGVVHVLARQADGSLDRISIQVEAPTGQYRDE